MSKLPSIHPLVRKLWKHWDRPTEWDTDKGILLKLAYDLADALEHQQAVVEAARHYVKGHLSTVHVASFVDLKDALAALDAPQERNG